MTAASSNSPPAAALDDALAALAHPVRRAMLDRLVDGACTVGELSAPFAMKKPTLSRHIRQLEAAGLINRSVNGRQHFCRINPDGVRRLDDWLARYRRFWTGQLDELERYLTAEDGRSVPEAGGSNHER